LPVLWFVRSELWLVVLDRRRVGVAFEGKALSAATSMTTIGITELVV
jgi:hypothetical protein